MKNADAPRREAIAAAEERFNECLLWQLVEGEHGSVPEIGHYYPPITDDQILPAIEWSRLDHGAMMTCIRAAADEANDAYDTILRYELRRLKKLN